MIVGKIIHGDGVGKTLGFPTANIACNKYDVSDTPGVYAAWAIVEDVVYPAALVIQADPWKVEVYLIGYEGEDIYGKELKIDIVEQVSLMEQYEGKEKLIEKINRDVEAVRNILQ